MQTKLPTEYFVWDLETSGLDYKADKILEIGYMHVKDGAILKEESFLLNHNIEISETTTKLTGITKAMIDEKGISPLIAYEILKNLFRLDIPHISHNGFRFDLPFFFTAIGQTMKLESWEELRQIAKRNMIDTAVIYKAREIKMERLADETFYDFSNRVMEVRAFGVKYNVGVCCDKLTIDRSNVVQHRANADIFLTNEIFKKLIA